jgi:hypothetical protein
MRTARSLEATPSTTRTLERKHLSNPLSLIVTPTGKPFGRVELAERIQHWLLDERVVRRMLKHALPQTSVVELALIHRDLPKMTVKGLARVALWILRTRQTRLAVARVEIVGGSKRQQVREELHGLSAWAAEAIRQRESSLILPS